VPRLGYGVQCRVTSWPAGTSARPKSAIAEIQKQKAEGADLIKAVDGSPDPYLAPIADATRKIPVLRLGTLATCFFELR
jgi:hypothetical protein